jgi:7-carboxy-7-deazaguanine synthase
MGDLSLGVRICEVFNSLQGEGPYVGWPATFIRTAGCNLRCPLCDTKYSWENSGEIAIDDLAKMLTHRLVVITGGEPLLQREELAKLLWYPGHIYQFETNGTIAPRGLEKAHHVVSPKLKYFFDVDYKPEVIEAFNSLKNVWWKFVVRNKDDVIEVLSFLHKYNIPEDKVYLMPEGATRESVRERQTQVAELCLQFGLKYSPRLHIDLWGGKRGY